MKDLIKYFGIALFIFLFAIIYAGINIKSANKDAAFYANRNASYHVVNEVNKEMYQYSTNNQAIASYIEDLLSQSTGTSNVKIQILGINQKEGAISVKVTQVFTLPNGKKKTESYTNTVILEDYPKNP